MKTIKISLAALFLCIFSSGLRAQEIFSTTDSSIVCTYTSDGDSTFKTKIVTYNKDSILNYTVNHRYYWNAGSAVWDKIYIYDYSRDSEGKLLDLNQYKWDVQGADWYHRIKEKLSYNSDGKMTSDIMYVRLVPEDEWFGDMYYIYEYDSAGNRTLFRRDAWNELEADWNPDIIEEYEVDTAGRTIVTIDFKWISSEERYEERGRRKYEYAVDLRGEISSKVEYTWNKASEQWLRSSMTTFEYNDSGLVLQQTSHSPINAANNNEWHPYKMVMKAYDDFGNRVLYTNYENRAVYPEVEWIGYWYKSESAYTADGNLNIHARYDWNAASNDWKFAESDENIYNNFGFRTTQITFKPDQSGMDSVLVEKEFFYPGNLYCTLYDTINSGDSYLWEGQEIREEGIYQEAFTSVMGSDSIRTLYLSVLNYAGVEDDLLSNGIELFPVPVKDFLQVRSDIDYMEIAVVDMKGREVIRTHERSVDLSNLKSGIYMVRLRNRNGEVIKVRKILKN